MSECWHSESGAALVRAKWLPGCSLSCVRTMLRPLPAAVLAAVVTLLAVLLVLVLAGCTSESNPTAEECTQIGYAASAEYLPSSNKGFTTDFGRLARDAGRQVRHFLERDGALS